ncbi:MAG: hypothetical protein LBS16_02935 [Prevotellaceae bacterium]|jgi:hypothetical protein|nr:hypothetical protein [Prevotellaceae bacterium]
MVRKFFSCIAASVLFCAGLSAQVFIIERGSNTTLTFTNIKAAVDALQDNDQLYIPPGEYSLDGYTWEGYEETQNNSNTLMVNKKVSIYGAGYSNGANSSVITGGDFVIGKDASGSLITGIRFGGSSYGFILDNVSNVSVTRCKIDNSFSLHGIGNNINISECDIYRLSTTTSSYANLGGQGLSASFSKCIFRYSTNRTFRTAMVSNSIFLNNGGGTSFYSGFYYNNTSFHNNIFIVSATVTNSSCSITSDFGSFSHNLWVGGYPSSNAEYNNTFSDEIEREPYANVFVDPANGDYHLKTECTGKNAGSDGNDVGIYGTAIPFKESKLPSIPHFVTKVISSETDATGKLPVNIKIEAQDR